MKRFIVMILFIFIIAFSANITAYAGDGEGNMSGGGGGMGSGTAENVWHNGDDGVRVTVVRTSDNKPVSTPIDLTNKNESSIHNHFGKVCKLQYKNGVSLIGTATTYTFINPGQSLPTIITGNSTNNIAAIKSYFTDQQVIKRIASWTGIPYDKLTDGTYKLLLEPIAYFTFEGFKMAMTATEAAKYDQMLSGGLRSKMVSLSHQNLPLSMFLQTADMGYPAYKGSTSKPQSDTTIINQLGLGIVKFKDDGGSDPTPPASSTATYRVNTDVVTAVTLSTDDEIDPDHTSKVTFHINGGTYTMTNIVIPQGESQLVWCKWHTPSTPQTINISVSASKGSLDVGSIKANIVSMDGHEPPDPTASDRNDSFRMPSVPSPAVTTSNSWGVWSGYWVPNWVWHEDWHWVSDPGSATGGHWKDKGKWVDEGSWHYDFTSYHAKLSASMSLMPSKHDWSAKGKEMKSGYGVTVSVNGVNSSNASLSQVTAPQTGLCYFPEFDYKTYWRHLDCSVSGTSAALEFAKNKYSTYEDRVQFTPLWFPDNKYTVYAYLEDAWTPAGMLSYGLSDYVVIKGNVYQDWHIGPKLVD
ncbi:hypothetical protein CAFE_11470 [Caprobacter fermentans]|uniref:Uncharacterized protein n=1 Tax=Caproicibacter fermentans TaxID=2576756 RepID=A0A6N8HXR2_9FIRM|nr:hypothetical protein [Caproicibacter fermentans]MVB10458.1 hypothetical protein [Caproicibacter fermentans]